jgi:hypothetical protein
MEGFDRKIKRPRGSWRISKLGDWSCEVEKVGTMEPY